MLFTRFRFIRFFALSYDGVYQPTRPSTFKEVSKECWTEIPLEGNSYEQIADEFEKFDAKYRSLLIAAGAEM